MEAAKARKAQLVCDRKKFRESLPKIINQVIGSESSQTQEATEHFQQVCSAEILFVLHNLPLHQM